MKSSLINHAVRIVRSSELVDMKLGKLAGRTGIVVEIAKNGHGMFVKLDKPYLGEDEWYIPKESIQYYEL